MTICEFLTLSEQEQEDVVWSHTHIAEREEEPYWILLYQVDGFYVELYYDLKSRDLCGFHPFICTGQLEPYLNQIDLSGLFDQGYNCS